MVILLLKRTKLISAIINIAFSDIEGIERKPIIALLQQFIDLTTSIVDISDITFFNSHNGINYAKGQIG